MLQAPSTRDSRFKSLDRLARTFVREGSLLYPYRRDAAKNRFGWHFGSLLPPAFCASEYSGDRSWIQTECLVEAEAGRDPLPGVKIQFLQISGESLVERELLLEPLSWPSLRVRPSERLFRFAELEAALHVSIAALPDELFRLTVRVFNLTPFHGTSREEAMHHALISTHTLLVVEQGRFHSLIDPPPAFRAHAEACQNVGVWPVLAGCKRRAGEILASPFILYDYPELAPESPVDFCDCTEIDELLTLRLLTLTPAEQRALRSTREGSVLLDGAARVLQNDEFLKLHGAIRDGIPAGCSVRVGDRVRLKPGRRADILDIVLTGRIATVCSLEEDASGRLFACVTIDEDPGKDLGHLGQPGHRFFFGVDEMEPLS